MAKKKVTLFARMDSYCCDDDSEVEIKVGRQSVTTVCYDGWKKAGLPELPERRNVPFTITVDLPKKKVKNARR